MEQKQSFYTVRRVSFASTGDHMHIFEPDTVDENDNLIKGAWRDVNYYLSKYPGRIIQIIHNPDSPKFDHHMVLIEHANSDMPS